MANRLPIVLDTEAGELKEIPLGDTLDLTNNQITGLVGLDVTGTVEALAYTQNGVNLLSTINYNDINNLPDIPGDINQLEDVDNIIPNDVADLTDNTNLLGGANRFTELADTPDTFTGRSGQILAVNPEETALGFIEYSANITQQDVIDALGFTPYNETNPEDYVPRTDINDTFITDRLGYTPYNGATNPNGYISGITVTDVVNALGYSPYPDTNPDGYFNTGTDIITALGYTPYNGTTNPNGYFSSAAEVTNAYGYTPYDGVTNSEQFLKSGEITSQEITDALGYIPYNGSTNINGYIFDSAGIVTALGFTPYSDTNPSGFITGINSADVTNALGFTPYSNTNPNGYVATTVEINALYGYIPYDATTNEAGFINAEQDTLDSVTSRDSTTTNSITVNTMNSTTISTSGNATVGSLNTGNIVTGTTSVIDGDTAGDTLRVGGTSALTLGSSGNITIQASIIGSDTAKDLGTTGVPFRAAYITTGNIGGIAIASDTLTNSDGRITLTPSNTDRVRVSAGAFTLPVQTPTTKGNITGIQSGDTVYVNDGVQQYAQTYDGAGSVWKTITGPRYVVDNTNAAPTFNGAYYGEMIVFENVDGDHTVYIWVFNSASGGAGADEWVALWETPA